MASRSREGAWIEMIASTDLIVLTAGVAPVRERGLKYLWRAVKIAEQKVAPVRERGLKYPAMCRICEPFCVAPVRERGLKSYEIVMLANIKHRRSREGAWIEIAVPTPVHVITESLP